MSKTNPNHAKDDLNGVGDDEDDIGEKTGDKPAEVEGASNEEDENEVDAASGRTEGETGDDVVPNAVSQGLTKDRTKRLGLTYARYRTQLLFRDEKQFTNGVTEPFVTKRGGEFEMEESIKSDYLSK